MSLLLLFSQSGPPPEPVTVIGYATPSAYLHATNPFPTRNTDASYIYIDPADAYAQEGEFCVVVVAMTVRPSYMPLDIASAVPADWNMQYVNVPSNPYDPYESIGYAVFSTTYTGSTSVLALPLAFLDDVNAYISRYWPWVEYPDNKVGVASITANFDYSNRTILSNTSRTGPTLLANGSKVLHVASTTIDAQPGSGGGGGGEGGGPTPLFTSLSVAPSPYTRAWSGNQPYWAYGESENIEPNEYTSLYDIYTSAVAFENISDEALLLDDVVTVFPVNGRSQGSIVVCVWALSEGFTAQAEITDAALTPGQGKVLASAVIRVPLTARYGSLPAEAEIVGERVEIDGVSRVTLNLPVAAELIEDVRKNAYFSASAEIEQNYLSDTIMQHPRESLLHEGHTLSDQVLTTSVVLGFAPGSVLQDVLEAMWDEYARLSSINRWPKSFSASAEVV